MLLDLHEAWAWVVVVGNGLAGGWALAALKVPDLDRPALWWFIGFAQVAIFAQVILGVLLLTVEDLEVAQFHQFYGFIAIIAVGIIHSYRNQLHGRILWLYGLGSLFLMGLSIRAMLLGAA